MATSLPASPQLVKIDFRQGINKELTRYSGEGGWYDSDMIRFRFGRPERIGGWQNVNGVGNTDTFDGIARNLMNWNSLDGLAWTAIGTATKLYLWEGGTYSDITPVRASVSATDIFSTSIGSNLVVVSIASHGAVAGDTIIFTSVNVTVGGNVKVSGSYVVVSVIDAVSFTISVNPTAAATSASGGGPSTGFFLLSIGDTDGGGAGWGSGTWGRDTWGSPVSGATSITAARLRTWSFDNWGEDLVACPRPGGQIFLWDRTSGSGVRASAIPSAPSRNDLILVSQEDRHLISFGCPTVDTSVYNPLYIRWCASENFSDWAASAGNTAGDKLLSGANRIVAAQRAKGQILVWTDDELYGMQFTGPPFTFSFANLGVGCGLVGPNAMVQVGGITYWMADQKFMVYDGSSPRPLRCDVLRHVFDNLNTQQLDKIIAASNAEFNEVVFFYQSNALTSDDIDSCIIYNYLEDAWSIGTLARTAWADRGVYGQPVGAGLDRKLYFHEVGTDDDGSPIAAFVESNEFDLGDGQDIMFLDRIIPDFSDRDGDALTGNVDLYLKYRSYPGAPLRVKGPFLVSAGTKKIDTRVRARQVAIRIESDDTGQSWRNGSMRFRVSPDGEQ